MARTDHGLVHLRCPSRRAATPRTRVVELCAPYTGPQALQESAETETEPESPPGPQVRATVVVSCAVRPAVPTTTLMTSSPVGEWAFRRWVRERAGTRRRLVRER
jgi:hypothetical protein